MLFDSLKSGNSILDPQRHSVMIREVAVASFQGVKFY